MNKGRTSIPRVVIAALRGGAGKTFVTVGLIAALRTRGLSLAVFKKGPDYIDAGWLGLAAGGECHNLDAYLFDKETVCASFVHRSADRDVAVVEGNRGVFDGVDSSGSYSTAELAKLLKAPVILLVDVTKMTRTAAALVEGCRRLDPELEIRGVILNRVGGTRHEQVVRAAIEDATSIPVIGSVRKMGLEHFPQRHLGLLPWHEHPAALGFIQEAATIAEQSIDLEQVIRIARDSNHVIRANRSEAPTALSRKRSPATVVGVLQDSAFQFYYPENLEALSRHGAGILPISALERKELPRVDALYIGGGFPETHARNLADNVAFRTALLEAARNGLPIYAECGGLMYLSRSLAIDEQVFPMAGVLPVETALQKTPQGHGYIRAEVVGPNPFYPTGTLLTGHEFHYSRVTHMDEAQVSCAFKVVRGHGIDGARDGLCRWNTLATYVHVHALGEPLWARSVIERALAYRQRRR
ncbi:MAG: cobyrinate a,c-diamide synthase [Deltaproteobacteria bacterium]|nr:cobyrinate a,c-diamide synthase [Deltaproteobacteria bacterium]